MEVRQDDGVSADSGVLPGADGGAHSCAAAAFTVVRGSAVLRIRGAAMTAPHLVEELLEDDELDEQPRTVHVYPVFGRRHVLEGPCWCEPWLYEDGVVVHN